MKSRCLFAGCLLLAVLIDLAQPLCVLESDFGFKINCAFKKSGLFRVRNLGGIKAHASLGFSLGDELGFDQSLTNLDPSRRRSVSVKNGPPNLIDTPGRSTSKQEKRGKQNRIMRPVVQSNRPNQAAMDKLTSLHRRVATTMQPIIVSGPVEPTMARPPAVTMAKPMPMGVPPFRPLPPKEDTLGVLPINPTRKSYTPLQIPQSKGPGLVYQNPVPHQVHNLANAVYNTKKIDDYNTITGYGDDTTLTFNKEDINNKIAEIAKAGNISMEAVEAAIALRQQQLLSKYANIPVPTTSSTTSSTTTTPQPFVFQPEPEPEILIASLPQKPKRVPTSGKVMNAPKEYYPVGYEKNFDDHFQTKVDLPDTTFHCGDQKYFPGLYGDETLGCMVFHVCALTDDGLVMKSFLCPESTLFDQTILKCNWWFYVDCKNTKKLYDTNIPVSKSYQLMKALTFFSTYKKEMQNDGHQPNPEDVDGVKEAISILENQDSRPAQTNTPTAIHYITPTPLIDERNNHQVDTTVATPIYRGNRNYDANKHVKRNTTESDIKLITVNADMNITQSSTEDSKERKHRRRMTLKNSTTLPKSTPKPEALSPLVEVMQQEIQPIESIPDGVKEEKLIDQLDEMGSLATNSAPIRRVYRSSAEKHDAKEMAVVNNEMVQIVRPKFVGHYPTPSATIEKLDEAILGKRSKKEAVTIVTPQKVIPNT